MTSHSPSLKVLEVTKIPRKPEYLVRLGDGSVLLAFKDDLAEMDIHENAEISRSTVDEMRNRYQYRKAKQVAMRLLKLRPRSEGEIRKRFSSLKIDQAIQESVIKELRSARLLDDLRFARLWIDQRKSRLGNQRLVRELSAKGIDCQTIEQAMALEYDLKNEIERIEEIVRKRMERLKGLESNVMMRRIYEYLVRRGFEPELVSEIIRKQSDQA